MCSKQNSAKMRLRISGVLPDWRCHFGRKSHFPKIVPWAPKQKFLSFRHHFDKKMVRSTLLCRFSGGPFGQKISFNANVWFSKISQQIDSTIESIIEIESHLQKLQCLTIQINVFKAKFSRDEVEKISFNANVWFSKISQQIDSTIENIIEIQFICKIYNVWRFK